MDALKDGTHLYEVERRVRYAERPGFRITELQIGPRQQVPWHSHTRIQDTFYVLEGQLRLFLREPKEEVRLRPTETYAVRPGRPHLVANGGDTFDGLLPPPRHRRVRLRAAHQAQEREPLLRGSLLSASTCVVTALGAFLGRGEAEAIALAAERAAAIHPALIGAGSCHARPLSPPLDCPGRRRESNLRVVSPFHSTRQQIDSPAERPGDRGSPRAGARPAGLAHPSPRRRSSTNSDAGLTPVTSRWSRARVHATYSRRRSVSYTSSRSPSSVTASMRACSGTTSSSHAMTATARNSRPLLRCMLPTDTRSRAVCQDPPPGSGRPAALSWPRRWERPRSRGLGIV